MPLNSIEMVNARDGWAASQSDDVLRTEDGGTTWYDVTPGNLPKAGAATTPTMPFFLKGDSQTAWLLDLRDETVYRTTDGGKYWQKGTPPDLAIANDGGTFLNFTSPQRGWLLVGTGAHNYEGQLFKTVDGGMSWAAVTQTGKGEDSLPYAGPIVLSPTVDGLGWLRPDRYVGAKGTPPLYVTHDGGKTWQPLPLPFSASDQISALIPSDQVYVQLPQFNGAKDGVLPVTLMSGKYNLARFFTTHDGGQTWNLAQNIDNVGSSVQLITSVVDGQTFWCYVPDGNVLWSTRDGGQSWDSFNPRPSLYEYQASLSPIPQLDFLSADEGWAVVNGGLLHTTDGGKTWAEATAAGTTYQPVGGIINTPPNEIHMLDEQNGYGWSSDHPIMVTSDGGASWTDATPQVPGTASQAIDKGYFIDAQTGWAFELQPEKSVTVYGTQDGGQPWSQLAIVPVKYGDGNMSIAFSDAQHGWFEEMTAGNGQLEGELFATSDGGKTWQRVAASAQQGNLPFGGQLMAQKNGTLWLSGGQRAAGTLGGPGFVWLYNSTNGGKTWSQVNLPLSAAHKKETNSVSKPVFFGNNGFVTVLFQGDSVLYATQDGGRTWAVRSTLKAGSWPVFGDAMFGWQTTSSQIYFTKDGGRTWQRLSFDSTLQKSLTGRFIAQVDFVDSQKGWLVLFSRTGNLHNMLLMSNDGGKSWRGRALLEGQ